jgi:hypothetical protein
MSNTPGLQSLLLCGSLAKGDAQEGWSDIDLVAVEDAQDRAPSLAFLQAVNHTLARASAVAPIGIGIDCASAVGIVTTGRIGGRPLAMTYEVAQYARVLRGSNVLREAPPLSTNIARIVAESTLLIEAELHNWRREYVYTVDHDSVDWLAQCVKTLLKLLKRVVEPHTVAPYTLASYVDVLKTKAPMDHRLTAFSHAVETRASWVQVTESQDQRKVRTEELTSELAGYSGYNLLAASTIVGED